MIKRTLVCIQRRIDAEKRIKDGKEIQLSVKINKTIRKMAKQAITNYKTKQVQELIETNMGIKVLTHRRGN